MADSGEIFQPPRDEDGRVLPHDSPNIAVGDTLVRYIPIQWLVDDEKSPGQKRLSSGAFSESSGGGMSIDIEKMLMAAGVSLESRVNQGYVGAARLVAGELRTLTMLVGEDPLENNPQHGEVWRITSSKKKKLQQQFVWAIRPKSIA